MQCTIECSRVPGESGALSHTAFRVHVPKGVPSRHLSMCSQQSFGNSCSCYSVDNGSLIFSHTLAPAAPETNRESLQTALLIVLIVTVAGHTRHLVCWENGIIMIPDLC